ncbi:MAG: hypothetical protein WCS15_01355 [Prevotella sp.]
MPDIKDYKPFYIQTESDAQAIDTSAQWGMVALTNPYPVLPSPKDTYVNDWKDENGDDEYNTNLYYSSFKFSVKFYIKTVDTEVLAIESLRTQMQAFFNKIKNGEFKIYDSASGLGRKEVRYAGYTEEGFKLGDGWARDMFTIDFKVNDPITLMKLANNVITEV